MWKYLDMIELEDVIILHQYLNSVLLSATNTYRNKHAVFFSNETCRDSIVDLALKKV